MESNLCGIKQQLGLFLNVVLQMKCLSILRQFEVCSFNDTPHKMGRFANWGIVLSYLIKQLKSSSLICMKVAPVCFTHMEAPL